MHFKFKEFKMIDALKEQAQNVFMHSQTGTVQQATFRKVRPNNSWIRHLIEINRLQNGPKENQTCKQEDEQKRWESEVEFLILVWNVIHETKLLENKKPAR